MKATHPFAAGVSVPLYVANFVLMEYGAGAIFGCPGHDARDMEFARKYALNVKCVVAPKGEDAASFAAKLEAGSEAFTNDGVAINSGFMNGLSVNDAKSRAIAELEKLSLGKGAVQYRLRDWGCRGNAIGAAPFRSFIANHAVLSPCLTKTCQSNCPMM